MPTKTDSSAARNNQLTNNTVDLVLVQKIAELWDYGSVIDDVVVEYNREHLADAVQHGIALKEASPSTWLNFLEHPLWQKFPKRRPKKDDQHDAPKYALAVFLGRLTVQQRKRATIGAHFGSLSWTRLNLQTWLNN